MPQIYFTDKTITFTPELTKNIIFLDTPAVSAYLQVNQW
jgi:hypothetical protein